MASFEDAGDHGEDEPLAPPTTTEGREEKWEQAPKNACNLQEDDIPTCRTDIQLVSELMKRKPKAQKPPSQFRHPQIDINDLHNPRNNLLPHIQKPEESPAGSVIFYDEDWVLIKDLYPKSTVHLLLLPRSPQHYSSHPYDMLQDQNFLAAAKPQVEKAKDIAASELRRLHGSFSASEKPRLDALNSDDPPEELPAGRDWRKEVFAGVHTHPSMNHMHIHILSVDRYSPCLKHRKHYNSFNTDFFVPVDAFPLSPEDRQRRLDLDWPRLNMTCWRCGRNFGNKFNALKQHLESEFKDWQKQ